MKEERQKNNDVPRKIIRNKNKREEERINKETEERRKKKNEKIRTNI